MTRARYPTDLTDRQWRRLAPLIPAAKPGGRPRSADMREVVNAILYVLRNGVVWRALPHDFPPWKTAYHYFRAWRQDGTWERIWPAPDAWSNDYESPSSSGGGAAAARAPCANSTGGR
jgi:putative transposase